MGSSKAAFWTVCFSVFFTVVVSVSLCYWRESEIRKDYRKDILLLYKNRAELSEEAENLWERIKGLQKAVNELQERKCRCPVGGCEGNRDKSLCINGVEVDSFVMVTLVCGGNVYLQWRGKDHREYNKIVTVDEFVRLVHERK